MNSPQTALNKLNKSIGTGGRVAFLSSMVCGLIAHMSILVSDIPNHDGLASMYFDQNMITSGRWFLGTACAITSYYSVPWLIGILSLFYLSISVILLVKVLDMKNNVLIALAAGMVATFPVLTSNFAYVFTMDGYMLGILLAIASVLSVRIGKLGFVFGAVLLSLSMGIYQAYLPVAVLLSLYCVIKTVSSKKTSKTKLSESLRYVYMGVLGCFLYYALLKILLAVQGKELSSYQGIDGMNKVSESGLLGTVKLMYSDFISFTLKSQIVFSNVISAVAVFVLFVIFAIAVLVKARKKRWYGNIWFYCIVVLTAALIPTLTNCILLVSGNVTYHLLMRFQWVLFGVMALAQVDDVTCEYPGNSSNLGVWVAAVASFVIVFSYIVADNIGYSNLEKKYEKTYSYCLRLADRIEQTEGYYEGIPIYMIGVVGSDSYPVTDITSKVTGSMLGIGGDYLLYTSENYELFYKYYMGITFNFLSPEEANFYDSPEYIAMDSFPGKNSVKVVDGVLYVKTENVH